MNRIRRFIDQLPVFRDLAFQLVIRDIKLRYRRTALGVIWLFVFPVFQIVVLNFVFTVVLPTRVVKYSVFVAIGVLIWTWFQTSLVMATTAITGNRELVRRPGMPTSILPVTTVATNMVLLLMAAPAIVGLVLFSGGHVGSAVVVLPVAVVVQFALTLGLAYMVASLNVTFRDTQHLVPLGLLLLFFISPIFYDVSNVPAQYHAIYNLNPFVILLSAYRAPFLINATPNLVPLAELGLISLLVWLLGQMFFRRASRRFAEEI
jgi:lipopolysaccharide transport system permease protein